MADTKVLLLITPSCNFAYSEVSLREKNLEVIAPPLGPAYLAAVLRDKGIGVEIYDPHIENYDKYSPAKLSDALKKKISSKISSSDHTILGVASQYLYTNEWAHFIAAASKRSDSSIPVIFGGGYPSMTPEKVIEDENVDYVVIGEAEWSFPILIKDIVNHSEKINADGIAFRVDGEVQVSPKTTFVENVDEIPFPAWDMVNLERYFEFQGNHSLNVISSRACPYSCTFCNSYKTWGRGFRKRSASNIISEINYLNKSFGIDSISFVDDNMTVDKTRFMKIAKGLQDLSIHWSINNISSFTTDTEMLEAMKQGGCDKIAIAVETVNDHALKSLRKPVNLKRTKELLRECREIGLRCNVLIIAGLPYETKEDMLRTFDFCLSAGADWCTISMLVPFPGTDIYEYSKERNYFAESNLDFSKFTLRNQGFLQTEHWSREWVADAAHEANIQINFLHNYNITHDNGDLDYAIKIFSHVFHYHPRHIIAGICLAYAYFKKGDIERCDEYIKKAQNLYQLKEVQKDYGRFFDMNEPVIDFYFSKVKVASNSKK